MGSRRDFLQLLVMGAGGAIVIRASVAPVPKDWRRIAIVLRNGILPPGKNTAHAIFELPEKATIFGAELLVPEFGFVFREFFSPVHLVSGDSLDVTWHVNHNLGGPLPVKIIELVLKTSPYDNSSLVSGSAKTLVEWGIF